MRAENEQRRPGGGGEVRSNDHNNDPIVPRHLELDATAGDPVPVTLIGFDGNYVPPFVDASPLGLAVVPVGDALEIVVLVSARRRRPGVAS